MADTCDLKEPEVFYPVCARVRGLGVHVVTPNGQEWRSAVIDAPFYAASTPQAFYAFLEAAAAKDPNALKQYAAVHPEILTFIEWVAGLTYTVVECSRHSKTDENNRITSTIQVFQRTDIKREMLLVKCVVNSNDYRRASSIL